MGDGHSLGLYAAYSNAVPKEGKTITSLLYPRGLAGDSYLRAYGVTDTGIVQPIDWLVSLITGKPRVAHFEGLSLESIANLPIDVAYGARKLLDGMRISAASRGTQTSTNAYKKALI